MKVGDVIYNTIYEEKGTIVSISSDYNCDCKFHYNIKIKNKSNQVWFSPDVKLYKTPHECRGAVFCKECLKNIRKIL